MKNFQLIVWFYIVYFTKLNEKLLTVGMQNHLAGIIKVDTGITIRK